MINPILIAALAGAISIHTHAAPVTSIEAGPVATSGEQVLISEHRIAGEKIAGGDKTLTQEQNLIGGSEEKIQGMMDRHKFEMQRAMREPTPAALLLHSMNVTYTQYNITSKAKVAAAKDKKSSKDYTQQHQEATLKVIASLKATARLMASDKGQSHQIMNITTTEKDGWIYGSAQVLVTQEGAVGDF